MKTPTMRHNPQNLLVTGGAGFIGANFVHYWLSKYPEHRITVLDALTYAGNMDNLETALEHPNFSFIHGSINDFDLALSILRQKSIDTIVHFAAESHVDRSILGPDEFITTNVVGTHTLLKAARSYWLDAKANCRHRFHHVSTDEVYGSLPPEAPAFTETNQYIPNSPYAASKASSDHLVRAYHETYGLDATISNCSNNYGPFQFPEKLIPLMIVNILQGKSLPVYGDGLQIRDWLYVDDHSRGIDLVITRGKSGEVYNIGGNNEWKNIDIVGLICRLLNEKFSAAESLGNHYPKAAPATGKPAETMITHVKDRLGHDRRYAIDAGKITRNLGYTPHESFETGIQKTLNWYLDNEQWWCRAMNGSYREWLERNYGIPGTKV